MRLFLTLAVAAVLWFGGSWFFNKMETMNYEDQKYIEGRLFMIFIAWLIGSIVLITGLLAI